MSSLINIYDGILQYFDNEIVVIIDNHNNIWFNGKQIVKILEYKNTNDAINNKVSKNNKISYEMIRQFSKNIHNYNIQNHSIFINENGLYQLILKSKTKKASDFQDWITSEVLPMIRKHGKYEMENRDKEKLKKLNAKINSYKKRIMILENNQSKPKYPKGGYIYALQSPDILHTDLYKTGRTEDLTKRFNVYNTSYADKAILIHKIKVNDPIAVEHCIKGFLNKYIYRNNNEFYKLDRSSLIKIMDKCASLIDEDYKKNKISRPLNNNNNEEIFSIYSFTKEDEEMSKEYINDNKKNMIGGSKTNIYHEKYIFNKNNYNSLCYVFNEQ